MKKWEITQNECKIYMERMYSNIYDYSKKISFEKRLELFPNIFWSMVRVARFFQMNGIMNCDIKSENVMLSKDGKTVRIIDFGHIISEDKYPIIGTRSYQPPELWCDDTYSYKSMVWSIGLTAMEFLYRIHPIVDIIYGEDSDSEISYSLSNSDTKKSKFRSRSRSRSGSKSSFSGSKSSFSGSYSKSSGMDSSYDYQSDTAEDDMYRNKYINLFEILKESGESLPFRHRLEPIGEQFKDKVRVINSIIERMLTYDTDKRISLDELYHHRIFDKIRGSIKDEPVMTQPKEQLFCDKELTPVFMTIGRKLYREEIMIHSYMLLTTYLEKKQRPSKQDFTIISMACLDIMSYVYSMVSSSRDLYRKIILHMKKITEHQLFERAIDIIKTLKCKIFFHGITDIIKKHDNHVVYPLLLELIEWEAEQGKKFVSSKYIVDRYMSSEFISGDMEEDTEDKENDEEKTEVHPSLVKNPFYLEEKKQSVPKQTDPEPEFKPKRRTKEEDVKEITEYDINPQFLDTFKEQIKRVYEQELIKKMEEEKGDVLIIEL
jgi:serine/threonine protein kinase